MGVRHHHKHCPFRVEQFHLLHQLYFLEMSSVFLLILLKMEKQPCSQEVFSLGSEVKMIRAALPSPYLSTF